MNEKQDQFTAIWTAAKAQYADVVGEDIDDPSFPHPLSTDELLASLDKQNKNFKHFREKRARPIELVGNLAAGGAAMAFPPSTLRYGAAMYLINAAHGVSASYDAIVDLLEMLKAIYNREDLPIELQKKLAEVLATYLEILARSTKVIKGGSAGRILSFAKNVVLGNDEKIQDLVSKLESLCQSENSLVGAETLIESKKTGRAVEGMSVTLIGTDTVVRDSNIKLNDVSIGVQQISLSQEMFRQEMDQRMNTVMSTIISTGKDENVELREKSKRYSSCPLMRKIYSSEFQKSA
ncbi:hypothetical protein AJ79_09575 [Helicocarpus griseus UAMH5409]|uniref:Fungal STAND N-terminal Goodbye domain-containing protein n=1 Tax=Helicocarpus griseus UAMH5409 TaxID=1447875 RepID=A0A2B7WIC1_9EURO|nr:hypothetical protein AJ79_09575 [Helicocarpus griseus UAMH5409]